MTPHNGFTTLLSSYMALRPGERISVLVSDEIGSSEGEVAIMATLRRAVESLGADLESIKVRSAEFDPKIFGDVVLYASKLKSIHKTELLEHLRDTAKNGSRFYRLFNFSNELFELCFTMRQEDLWELNQCIIHTGRESSQVRVASDAGTDLMISLDGHYDWTNSCGYFDGSFPGVLPPGEVNTYSPHVNGVIVADGAINASFGFPGDPRLSESPIVAEIVDSKVVSATSDSPVLQIVLNQFFGVENAVRVGEVGFGTNRGITRFVPFVSHINERYPGLHLGLGTPTQRAGSLDWSSALHLDLILASCEIWFDDRPIFSSSGGYDRDILLEPDVPIGSDTVLSVDAF